MMKFVKKICLVAVLAVALVFTGCEKADTAKYKEGNYTGSAVDTYGGEENTATAEIVVDKDGKITSVYLDTTYQGTTKKTLGADYNMKTYNPAAAGEWFEQAKALEDAVVEKQGIDFITLDDEGKTDAVSGCTIIINALVEAITDALEQAK